MLICFLTAIKLLIKAPRKNGIMKFLLLLALYLSLKVSEKAAADKKADVLGGGILYPRESETREVKLLDGVWNFRISESDPMIGFREKWFVKDLSRVRNDIVLFFFNVILQNNVFIMIIESDNTYLFEKIPELINENFR